MKPFFNTHEHDMVRDVARTFVARNISPHVDAWEECGGVPREMFQSIGAAGLLGVRFPESVGGGGGDITMALGVVEEFALCRSGGVVTSYLVQAHLVTPAIFSLGTPAQQAEFLAPTIAGDRVCCLAITEPDAGSDVAGMRTRGRRDGDDWVLEGAKQFITNGGIADYALVAARTGPAQHDLSLFLVDTGQPGFVPSAPLRKLGLHASNTVSISLDEVRVPARNVLGDIGGGFRAIMAGFQEERLVSAVYAYASAGQALEDALQYVQSRRAFGGRLSDLQALRHAAAQLAAELEAARQLSYTTAWSMHRGDDVTREISMAKLLTAEIANHVAYAAMQFQGGAGYMEESPASRYFRDIRLFSIGGGASEVQREIIAKSLLGPPSPACTTADSKRMQGSTP